MSAPITPFTPLTLRGPAATTKKAALAITAASLSSFTEVMTPKHLVGPTPAPRPKNPPASLLNFFKKITSSKPCTSQVEATLLKDTVDAAANKDAELCGAKKLFYKEQKDGET